MKEEFRELPDLTDQDKNEVGKQQALIAKQMGINASTLKAFACKQIHGKVAYLFDDESDVAENAVGGMNDIGFKKSYWLENDHVEHCTFVLKTAKTPEKDYAEINLKTGRRLAEQLGTVAVLENLEELEQERQKILEELEKINLIVGNQSLSTRSAGFVRILKDSADFLDVANQLAVVFSRRHFAEQLRVSVLDNHEELEQERLVMVQELEKINPVGGDFAGMDIQSLLTRYENLDRMLKNRPSCLKAANHLSGVFSTAVECKKTRVEKNFGEDAYDYFCPSDFDEFSRQSSLKSDLDQFSRQLSLRLKNLHKINIIHYDLKLGNILVTKDEQGNLSIEIIDFDFANDLSDGNSDDREFNGAGTRDATIYPSLFCTSLTGRYSSLPKGEYEKVNDMIGYLWCLERAYGFQGEAFGSDLKEGAAEYAKDLLRDLYFKIVDSKYSKIAGPNWDRKNPPIQKMREALELLEFCGFGEVDNVDLFVRLIYNLGINKSLALRIYMDIKDLPQFKDKGQPVFEAFGPEEDVFIHDVNLQWQYIKRDLSLDALVSFIQTRREQAQPLFGEVLGDRLFLATPPRQFNSTLQEFSAQVADCDQSIDGSVTGKCNTSVELLGCSEIVSTSAELNQLPIVLTGEQQLSNGNTIYLTFEQITGQNEAYWKYYTRQFATCYGRCGVNTVALAFVMRFLSENSGVLGSQEKFLKYLEDSFLERNINLLEENSLLGFCKRLYSYLSSKKHNQAAEEVCSKIMKLFVQVGEGAQGDLVCASAGPMYHSMVYASVEPITEVDIQSHCEFHGPQKGDLLNLSPHNNKIISVPFQTAKNEPTFTHFGLFKNPWHMIDIDSHYCNISMILKGFSATCVRELTAILPDFEEKTYFSTSPLRSLTEILGKAIGDKNIHKVATHSKTYGPDISRKGSDQTYTIEDPDCPGRYTGPLARLNFAGYNPYPSIIVKANRFEPFYEKSEKIKDPKTMLRLLTYLKHCDSELPKGFKGLICKAYPEMIEGEDDLTIDQAMALYQDLDAHNNPGLADNSTLSKS